jgi:hypothetical protein
MEGWIMGDIRTSQFGSTPFGTSETRPANPVIGQTYFNGTLGVQEIYTASGWLPATGANDFNVTLNGPVTTSTFTKEYFAGAYTIASALLDSTYDIYVYDTLGNLAGYTKSPSLNATGNFNKIVVVGGSTGDLLSFSYKTTFTATSTTSQVTAGAFITSVTPTALNSIDDTTTVVGGNFASNVAVYFVGSDDIEIPAKSIVRTSSSELIIARPDTFSTQLGTYKVVVENPGITRPTGSSLHILNNAITAGTTPNWTTATTLPEIAKNIAYTTTLVATDSEGTDIDYSIVSGTLPDGITLNNETGVLSGTYTGADFNTTNLLVRAVDTGGNTVDRTFRIFSLNPVWDTATSLPGYLSGVAYSTTLSVSDDNAINYSLLSGSLPSGITLNSSTGILSGTASGTSTFTFTIRATDVSGNFTDRTFTLSHPVTGVSGLYQWLTPESYSGGSSWTDASGSSRTFTLSGAYSKVDVTGNGSTKTISALQGTTSTRSNALGSGYAFTGVAGASTGNFTLFHVARYRGGSRERIWTGISSNWLSGFWGNASGVQYHEGWLSEGDKHGDNWVISSDQHNLYRSNGVTRGTSGNGNYNTAVDINNQEASDFHLAEVILYNRALTLSEIQAVEGYLSTKYGIAIP